MADGLDLTEIVRRTVQANARFYRGWVDLSLEYFRGISDIFGAAPPPAAESEPQAGAGVLVLEGEAGTAVRGTFLVTNDLGRKVLCELIASAFKDATGSSARAKVTFEPPQVELAPGEQRVVHATVAIDDQLDEGVGYSGEFAIRGMDGFSVPVVLRRRHRVEASPIDREMDRAQPAKGKDGTRTVPRKKAGRKKKSSGTRKAARRRNTEPNE